MGIHRWQHHRANPSLGAGRHLDRHRRVRHPRGGPGVLQESRQGRDDGGTLFRHAPQPIRIGRSAGSPLPSVPGVDRRLPLLHGESIAIVGKSAGGRSGAGGGFPQPVQDLEQAAPGPDEGPGKTGCSSRTRGNGDTAVRPGVLPAQAAVTQHA